MDDGSELTQEVSPEVVTPAETAEGQVKDQTANPPEGGEEEGAKSAAQQRRERQRAYHARLRDEATRAGESARQADQRLAAITKAGERLTEPTERDISDPIELAAARAVWRSERARQQASETEASTEAQEARRRADAFSAQEARVVDASWGEAVQGATARYADFDAIALNPELPISPAVGGLIKASDAGPDVLYHLGMHPEIAAQISSLPPVLAAMEIGRIAATINAPRPKTATAAPAPTSPVKGSAVASKDPASMSMEEYIAARRDGRI